MGYFGGVGVYFWGPAQPCPLPLPARLSSAASSCCSPLSWLGFWQFCQHAQKVSPPSNGGAHGDSFSVCALCKKSTSERRQPCLAGST